MTRKLTPKEIRELSDMKLQLEANIAVRCFQQAWDNRRENRRYEGVELEHAVGDADAYKRLCFEEIERRQAAGKWNPNPEEKRQPAVVKQPNDPKPTRQPNFPKSRRDIDEEPERPPIIVFEHGMPRAWRKGDPIHNRGGGKGAK